MKIHKFLAGFGAALIVAGGGITPTSAQTLFNARSEYLRPESAPETAKVNEKITIRTRVTAVGPNSTALNDASATAGSVPQTPLTISYNLGTAGRFDSAPALCANAEEINAALVDNQSELRCDISDLADLPEDGLDVEFTVVGQPKHRLTPTVTVDGVEQRLNTLIIEAPETTSSAAPSSAAASSTAAAPSSTGAEPSAKPSIRMESRYLSLPNRQSRQIANGQIATIATEVNANNLQGLDGSTRVKVTYDLGEHGSFLRIPVGCVGNEEPSLSGEIGLNADNESKLSPDRSVLTCDLGDMDYGSAAEIKASFSANGRNGDTITPKITLSNGDEDTLAKLTIIAKPPVLDAVTGGTSNPVVTHGGVFTNRVAPGETYQFTPVPFSIYQNKGSSPLDRTKPITLTIAVSDPQPDDAADAVEFFDSLYTVQPGKVTGMPVPRAMECGHFNGGFTSDRIARINTATPSIRDRDSFDCKATYEGVDEQGRGIFKLELTNFNPSPANRETTNQQGQPLPFNDVILGRDMTPIISGGLALAPQGVLFRPGGPTRFAYRYDIIDLHAEFDGRTLSDSKLDNNDGAATILAEGSWSAAWLLPANNITGPKNGINGDGTAWSAIGEIFSGQYAPFRVSSASTALTGHCIIWQDSLRLTKQPINEAAGKAVSLVLRRSVGTNPDVPATYDLTENSQIEYFYSANGTAALQDLVPQCSNDSLWSSTPPTETTRNQVRGVRFRNLEQLINEANQQDRWTADLQPITDPAHNDTHADRSDSNMNFSAILEAAPGTSVDAKLWAGGAVFNSDLDRWWSLDKDTAAVVIPIANQDYRGTNSRHDFITYKGAGVGIQKTSETPQRVGDHIKYEIVPTIFSAQTDKTVPVVIEDTLPVGLEVDPETISHQGQYDPVAGIIRWEIDAPVGIDNPAKARLTYTAAVRKSGTLKNVVVLTTHGDGSVIAPGQTARADRTIATPVAGITELDKAATAQSFAWGGSNTWTITLRNRDIDQEAYDIIDILPFNGDGRGTLFSGRVNYGEITVSDPKAVIYYTDSPAKELHWDPGFVPAVGVNTPTTGTEPEGYLSNGNFADPSDIWTPERPDQITAVRVVGKNLPEGAEVTVSIPFTPVNNKLGDTYVNQAWAKATTTRLEMIQSAESATVEEKSVLQVDKKLASNPQGPFGAGHEISYWVTVKNAGAEVAPDVQVKEWPDTFLTDLQISRPTQGTVEALTWKIGNLEPQQEVRALVRAVIAADYRGGEIINHVTVENPSHPYQPNFNEECQANDDTASDVDQCDKVVVEDGAKIVVSKSLVTSNTLADSSVVFEVKVTNQGSTTATNVVVADMPQENLAEVEVISTTAGDINAQRTAVTFEKLLPGATESFKVRARVIDPYRPAINWAVSGTPSDNCLTDDPACDIVEIPGIPPAPGENPEPPHPSPVPSVTPGSSTPAPSTAAPQPTVTPPATPGPRALANTGASVAIGFLVALALLLTGVVLVGRNRRTDS